MIDSEGNWPEFIDMLAEDMRNFDLENTDEQKVLNSHFFSAYKGIYVLRTNVEIKNNIEKILYHYLQKKSD